MNAPARMRAGWCPGAYNPMMSGDGLLVRVKPRGGALSTNQARGLAAAAVRHGNGVLDLTSRANLQIRGVREDTHAPLLVDLADLGLIDPSPAADAARNVVASPLAGLDPSAVLDLRPVMAALERRIAEDPTFDRLPAKFGFLLDDGGRLGLGDVAADLRFEALREDGAARFAVRLGGADAWAASCSPAEVPALAAALAHVFETGRRGDADLRRMRDLVRRDGASVIFARAGLEASPLARFARAVQIGAVVGRHEVSRGHYRVGAVAPFGRVRADAFETLAEAATRCGAVELRLTPWRAVLVAGLVPERADDFVAGASDLGWITVSGDARLRVAACPGAPHCHRGTTPILDHASRLAGLLHPAAANGSIAVHVSGCLKGCAHDGAAPLTLVGRDGRYDVVRRGRASDPAVARGLAFEAALALAGAGGGRP